MRSFDTNLLVRILTRDDEGQVAVIDRLLLNPICDGTRIAVRADQRDRRFRP